MGFRMAGAMTEDMQQCIDACLGGMKLQFAVKKFGLQVGSNSRAPAYRKLDKHIKKLKEEQRTRAGLLLLC